jgi:Tol biopolymer transport system component
MPARHAVLRAAAVLAAATLVAACHRPAESDRAPLKPVPNTGPTSTTAAPTPGDVAPNHLYMVDVATQASTSVLTDPALLDQPAWSADGTRIRFASGTKALTVPARGGAPEQVSAPAFVQAPAWSTTGQLAALSAAYDLIVTQPDGTSKRIAAKAVGPVSGRAWSADGTRIALIGGGRVWVANADTSDLHPITPVGKAWHWLAWSPDGTRIAYYQSRRLYVVGADGSNLKSLVPVNGDPSFDWAPDSTRLVVAAPREGNYAMGIVPVEGGSIKPLFADGIEVSWSPDGKAIAFKAWPIEEGVAVINADGSNRRTLITPPKNVFFALGLAWSPDSTKLVLSTGSEGPGGPREPV